jgi:hypothetical protein
MNEAAKGQARALAKDHSAHAALADMTGHLGHALATVMGDGQRSADRR